MKKKITVDGHQCNGCGKETEYAFECRICDKTFCLLCKGQFVQEYNTRGESFYYCTQCVNQLHRNNSDKVLNALIQIHDEQTQAEKYFAEHRDRLRKLHWRLDEALKQPDELPF